MLLRMQTYRLAVAAAAVALTGAVVAGLPAAPAQADEVIRTGAAGDPPASTAAPAAIGRPPAADASSKAGDPGPEALGVERRSACGMPSNRKPHGAVWGGIGTGGYRSVGGVVTQPLGDCGEVTVAIDRTSIGRR